MAVKRIAQRKRNKTHYYILRSFTFSAYQSTQITNVKRMRFGAKSLSSKRFQNRVFEFAATTLCLLQLQVKCLEIRSLAVLFVDFINKLC